MNGVYIDYRQRPGLKLETFCILQMTGCSFLDFVSGTAGDSLSYHRGFQSSTRDRGSRKECATLYQGAWWYNYCHQSNLNGMYRHINSCPHGGGVKWNNWRGLTYSLKRTEMKIRPVDF